MNEETYTSVVHNMRLSEVSAILNADGRLTVFWESFTCKTLGIIDYL